MHLLVVSQCYYPEPFRINDICKEWVSRGYKITVVTGIPNYPEGRFYSGYGWFKKRTEMVDGVKVYHIPIISRGSSSIRLILNYISFVISGFLWKCFTQVKPDRIFVFETSPMTQALPAVWFARKRRIPCDIYVQDLWPENVEFAAGIHNKFLIRFIDLMVDYIYRNCYNIFVTSDSFRKHLEKRNSTWRLVQGIKESKVIYWPQYAEEFYRPCIKKSKPQDMPDNMSFKVVFTGNVGYAQGLDILPKVAALLKEEQEKCEFIIIGIGRYMESFKKDIEAAGVTDMFHLLGRKMPEEIPEYLAWCDAAFISFAENDIFKMTIPAKLQSYMACGMPILAAAGGETKKIVENAGCGKVVRAGDYRELCAAVKSLKYCTEEVRREMGIKAQRYADTHFNKQKLFEVMDRIMENGNENISD
ncbi:MAG: glycosyltransferase family 4 protein [Ruminococcus flavefaciens]|nr:glycosyltransferase family 4 protein [Ruminococcus flavefaciens]